MFAWCVPKATTQPASASKLTMPIPHLVAKHAHDLLPSYPGNPPSPPTPQSPPPLPPPSLSDQSSILRQMLSELEGGDGELEASWVGFDPCGDDWLGVTCELTQQGPLVVGLDLSFRQFKGPLPPTLALITQLKAVSFLANE
eukprot:scaffold176198_cov19-Tisochrysis_lutea.AAC.1